jgi:hypothetical protein
MHMPGLQSSPRRHMPGRAPGPPLLPAAAGTNVECKVHEPRTQDFPVFIPDILANSLFHELPRPPGRTCQRTRKMKTPGTVLVPAGTPPLVQKQLDLSEAARPSPALRSVFFRKRGERA